LSVFAAGDGHNAVLFGSAQDHKRLGDGDTGPNTGGMGTFSPVPGVDQELLDSVVHDAVGPTLRELTNRGIDYRGFLFCGLMLTPDGPKVLEYNIRFGDPEAQVVLPRITSDLGELLAQAAAGSLQAEPHFANEASVCVVLAAEHYPATPRIGDRIAGIDQARALDGVEVYCAGVTGGDDGNLYTGGGRVLNVVGTGPTVADARERAYAGVAHISWPGMHHRRDIAASAATPPSD
jgi:phosphoribosylamine--glycine ligase